MRLRSRGSPDTGPDDGVISVQPARSRQRGARVGGGGLQQPPSEDTTDNDILPADDAVIAYDGIEGNPDEEPAANNDDILIADGNNNDDGNSNEEDRDGATSNNEEDNDEEDEGETESVQVDEEFLGVLGTFDNQNKFQYAHDMNPTHMFARPLIAPFKPSLPQFGKLLFIHCYCPGIIYSNHILILCCSFLCVLDNSWLGVTGPAGESLRIGTVTLLKRGEMQGERRKFANNPNNPYDIHDDRCPPPREVKAALLLSLQLKLHHYSQIDLATDSLMRNISDSSRIYPENDAAADATKCSGPSKNFVAALLNMLCFNLTFNEFFPREKARTTIDPKLAGKAAVDIMHNHFILVHDLGLRYGSVPKK